MYERFTDRARKVMQLANQAAQQFHHEYISTEHLLLGLVQEGSGVAGNVLKNLDVDLLKVKRTVESQLSAGHDVVVLPKLSLTPAAQKVIEFASEEAHFLNHNYVGTEHLLLGLLRESEGVAATVLTGLGLTLDTVREEVLNLLGHNLPAQPVNDTIYPLSKDISPPDLTAKEVEIIRGLLNRLNEETEASIATEDFDRARARRDEAEALKQLLAWYDWFNHD
jgi:ATP-dependent Clp protease ATP-binding subunit ClpC